MRFISSPWCRPWGPSWVLSCSVLHFRTQATEAATIHHLEDPEHRQCQGREKYLVISTTALKVYTLRDTDSCFIFHWSAQGTWPHFTTRVGIKYRIRSYRMPGRRRNWIFLNNVNEESRFSLLKTKPSVPSPFHVQILTPLPQVTSWSPEVALSSRSSISGGYWIISSPGRVCGRLQLWSKSGTSWDLGDR